MTTFCMEDVICVTHNETLRGLQEVTRLTFARPKLACYRFVVSVINVVEEKYEDDSRKSGFCEDDGNVHDLSFHCPSPSPNKSLPMLC